MLTGGSDSPTNELTTILADHPAEATKPSLGQTPAHALAALALLIVLNVADNVLLTTTSYTYGERLALFINVGTASVYIVMSLSILTWRRVTSKGRNKRSRGRPAPTWKLIGIGVLNGAANFCFAISIPHVLPLTQSLLGLLGIPLVMLLALLCLRQRPSTVGIFGAALIVAGLGVSACRTLILGGGGSEPVVPYWYSALLFAVGQLFLAIEKIFEEHSFGQYVADPMVMFAYTLVTQFVLYWLLLPLQTFSVFGGLRWHDLFPSLLDGLQCTAGGPPCGVWGAPLFWAYCAVDFWCYFFGLWVIQRGGASLMVLSSALALPLVQIVMCTPLVGRWRAHFFWGDGIALALVLAGFVVYQGSREGQAARQVGTSQGVACASDVAEIGDGADRQRHHGH